MAETEITDAELMLAYADGDQAAFVRLYERHRGPLYRYFRRQLPADQADDCFQVTWIKVIDNAPRYRPTGIFQHYLFTLAHNVLMDHHRKNHHRKDHHRKHPSTKPRKDRNGQAVEHRETSAGGDRPGASADLVDGGPGPDSLVAEAELRQRLLVLLQRLPFHQREVWVLKQEAALPVEAIAAITHTSVEGVRSRLRYATRKLKAGLARYV